MAVRSLNAATTTIVAIAYELEQFEHSQVPSKSAVNAVILGYNWLQVRRLVLALDHWCVPV